MRECKIEIDPSITKQSSVAVGSSGPERKAAKGRVLELL